MIPMPEFKSEMEKMAKSISETLWEGTGKGISGTLKFMAKHPKTTIGLIAASALATSLAHRLHPMHQMYREETKNVILKDNNKILLEILKSNKIKPVDRKSQERIISPLT